MKMKRKTNNYDIRKIVKQVVESIDIPDNSEWDGEDIQHDEIIEDILEQIDSNGGAYLDWGEFDDIYKNIQDKETAEEVAKMFHDKGYFVYYEGEGLDIDGEETPDSYTPIAIRILKKPIVLTDYDTEFTGEGIDDFE